VNPVHVSKRISTPTDGPFNSYLSQETYFPINVVENNETYNLYL
jgi:hypothetical protein